MPRAVVLLRALLCLVLLSNGIGYAHAATGMAAAMLAGSSAAGAGHHDAGATPPCHEDAGSTADADMPGAHMPDQHGLMPDCCQSGSCDGFCTQHAPALAWPAPLASLQPLLDTAPPYHGLAHPSPLLAHLQRPPIVLA